MTRTLPAHRYIFSAVSPIFFSCSSWCRLLANCTDKPQFAANAIFPTCAFLVLRPKRGCMHLC